MQELKKKRMLELEGQKKKKRIKKLKLKWLKD
jgi:hypothetical protein